MKSPRSGSVPSSSSITSADTTVPDSATSSEVSGTRGSTAPVYPLKVISYEVVVPVPERKEQKGTGG